MNHMGMQIGKANQKFTADQISDWFYDKADYCDMYHAAIRERNAFGTAEFGCFFPGSI